MAEDDGVQVNDRLVIGSFFLGSEAGAGVAGSPFSKFRITRVFKKEKKKSRADRISLAAATTAGGCIPTVLRYAHRPGS